MRQIDLSGLRDKLEEQAFPQLYMYKFIVPKESLNMLKQVLPDNSNSSEQPSKNGKYISVTIKKMAANVDEVLDIYQGVSEVPGLISL